LNLPSVVRYLLENDGSYEVLSHAGRPQNTDKDNQKIPSWAPDWRVPSTYKNNIVDWVPASPSSKSLVKENHAYLEDRGVLICMGYKFETIFSVEDIVQEIKPSPGSIGRIIWDNKFQRRRLIEHGVLSDLGTKLGTVSSLFARSHPLTFRRKLAKTKGETLCLVPQDTQVGDMICQFVGSSVPFIVRTMNAEDWKPKKSAWSKFLDKVFGRIFWWSENRKPPEVVNAEIRIALKAKKLENGEAAIEHGSFIGECFIDGLMTVRLRDKEGKVPILAFALH